MLGPKGRQIRIISKVENQEGIQNFDEILEKSDAIMVCHRRCCFCAALSSASSCRDVYVCLPGGRLIELPFIFAGCSW